MNKYTKDEYQDAYRKAWEAQNKIDARINKMVLVPGQHLTPQCDTETGRKHGKMGGRKKKKTFERLTDKAKVINNMMKHGLTAASIAGMLELPMGTVRNIEKRYGLPRNE